jgi:hypothetical protein
MIAMDPIEMFVKLCGEVGNYTERITGVSVVDAYSGPDHLAPRKQSKDKDPQVLREELESFIDLSEDDLQSPIRREYLIGETRSLITVLKWLSGNNLSYPDLVEGLFHIPMKRFSESSIDEAIAKVSHSLSHSEDSNMRDVVNEFETQGQIRGEELRRLIEDDLQNRTTSVGFMFKDNVYNLFGETVTDNGVEYSCVTDKPWSGYNWYQGGFKSLNEFNIDHPFNKDKLHSVIYHEYEHHVSNLWREKHYLESGNTDLAIVPLHTGRCVISEGTADTAKDFLGIITDDKRTIIAAALRTLRSMTSINAAIMMNHDQRSVEDAVEYLKYRGLRTEKHAKAATKFIKPNSDDGTPNFWAPYIFTYYFGRTDFVFPTFKKAEQNDVLPEFYRTIYLNPYSGSSITWKQAFEWL